ncbi:MAG: MBL fold metallo-hydrolase [Gemmataceae bacterium]|nr:MBL fold metallo-hydrolase [Gemmataceae bacterium]
MPLIIDVLGAAGGDSAALVRVDSGQAVHRLLFDCGEGCLSALDFGEVLQIDRVSFSHFHMDHVAGFDSLFRATFGRERPMTATGPEGSARILHHRFRGFLWNLHHGDPSSWIVEDVKADRVESRRFLAAEAFEVAHPLPDRHFAGVVHREADYLVEAHVMDHRAPSLAYVVRTPAKRNIDPAKLGDLKPGPWLKEIKEGRGDPAMAARLVTETPGESVAYLTDFLMDESAMARLEPALRGCKTVVCESQYRAADLGFAVKNYHMTCVQAAELARRADVAELVLFHLSSRYTASEWREMLAEARAVFPRTRFPAHWGMG